MRDFYVRRLKTMESLAKENVPVHFVIFLFFTGSYIGWLWEVLLSIILEGNFVNRGFMYGPWLPIYGFGVVLLRLLLKDLFNKPVVLFLLTLCICFATEFTTGWFLEAVFQARWWDYSHYPLNLNGYVTMPVLLFFSTAGLTAYYFLVPALSKTLDRIPEKLRKALLFIHIPVFAVDLSYSFAQNWR